MLFWTETPNIFWAKEPLHSKLISPKNAVNSASILARVPMLIVSDLFCSPPPKRFPLVKALTPWGLDYVLITV